ncbi:7,8-dihydroneopterin aldolase [Lentilactobacillus fungorum]|uniref:7,8-dihydroneopterin aldolase n=1 Tax=Lentilactobacillus fungorum TaxID=2201250 RepID=A0ABQ3VWB2_9LACO|nr:dihydroneopterin aldolase [Lentilactobacillus fungorum]GHP12810.1 7,8-dihydroneopterin aldolase [Lentilactobacillus fungorum]
MYTIKLNNMQFHSHIGVLPAEKVVGQALQIDLITVINADPQNDQLESTVSYGDFYQQVAQIVSSKQVDLLETLAQTILERIKSLDPRIGKTTVRIRKLALPIDGVIDNVEIEMERS